MPSLKLSASEAELRDRFQQLTGFSDVADLLEITPRQLGYYTHRGQVYKTFEIPKKRGGTRVISAPASKLIIIQRKLNQVLQAVYQPKRVVTGFLPGKNIIWNCEPHVGKRYVLNVDLRDFFPTITFPRVRGMFMAVPYSLPDNVATILARICCFDGRLPQGAPTSPVISNMICSKLDSQMRALAKKERCHYSRYADDITFSTYQKQFPKALAVFEASGEGGQLRVGSELAEIINNNGFSVNDKKVRLQHRSSRQEVTGLVVNTIPNIPRQYVRQVRAMLHAWRKFDLKLAGEHFFTKYDYRNRLEMPREVFRQVVKGKIDFIGMVKGRTNLTYISLLKQYSQLYPAYKFPPELYAFEANLAEMRKGVFVLEGDDTQGTGFVVKGLGIVTCNHVLSDNLEAYRPGDTQRFPVIVKYFDNDRDVAVLEFAHDAPKAPEFYESAREPKELDQVVLLGYPNHVPGATGILYQGKVIGQSTRFGQPRFLISCEITQGSSGGPVLDSDYRVIGIAANGKEKLGKRGDDLYGVIPIKVLREFLASIKSSSKTSSV
jgi:RNA-directed DNA polymerase